MTYEQDREKIMYFLEHTSGQVDALQREVQLLKFRSSLWGAISGALTVVLYSILGACLTGCPVTEYPAEPTIVDMTVVLADRNLDMHCAGVAIDHDLVVTAYHCIDEGEMMAPQVATREQWSRYTTHTGQVIGMDPTNDLAVLRVPGLDAEVIAPVATTYPAIGERVLTCGHPHGRLFYVSNGRMIDPYQREVASFEHWMDVDVFVAPGSSGGPLLNSQGELLGVASFIQLDSGIAGYTDPRQLWRLIDRTLR